ncbi:MAG: DUF2059 domain-containing protein [Bradymonadales bacterium]|nr:MAG: DUF2059 domain-containing protein [Bradymonadales bacterium]
MYFRSFLILACVFLMGFDLGAESSKVPTETADRKERLKAAEELLEAMNFFKTMSEMADQAAEVLVMSFPGLEEYRSMIEEFYREIFSGDDFRRGNIEIYVDSFTAAELRELVKFYKTPVGQKAMREWPKLFQRGAELGERLSQEAAPTLFERIEAAEAEKNKSLKPKAR